MTSLDYSEANPGGMQPHQWTDWASMFQPQLGSQMQPQLGPLMVPQLGPPKLTGMGAGGTAGRGFYGGATSMWGDVTDQVEGLGNQLGQVNDGIAPQDKGGEDPMLRPIAQVSAPRNNRDFEPQRGMKMLGSTASFSSAPPPLPVGTHNATTRVFTAAAPGTGTGVTKSWTTPAPGTGNAMQRSWQSAPGAFTRPATGNFEDPMQLLRPGGFRNFRF